MDLIDETFNEERTWNLVSLASAVLAGVVIRQVLDAGWQRIRHEDPPENPAARRVGWGSALAWTIASSVAVGLSRLAAERGAAAGWRKVRGRYPKGLH